MVPNKYHYLSNEETARRFADGDIISRRFILAAEPQVGKTGAYLDFIHRLLLGWGVDDEELQRRQELLGEIPPSSPANGDDNDDVMEMMEKVMGAIEDRRMRLTTQREGREKFRAEILERYNGLCVITGCSVCKFLAVIESDRKP